MKRKIDLQPLLVPVPVVIVSCSNRAGDDNALAIAWTGVVNSSPPMVSISVRPNRHSHHMILETGEFVINIPTVAHVRQTDYAGVVSGREIDKFAELGLGKLNGTIVKAPLIKECPINLECKTKHILRLGSHDMFVAEIVAVHVEEELVSGNGRLDFDKFEGLVYGAGTYVDTGNVIGSYGLSKK